MQFHQPPRANAVPPETEGTEVKREDSKGARLRGRE